MKKHNLCILFLALVANAQNAFAYDMTDGVWKGLIDEHQQNEKLVSGMLINRLYYNDSRSSNGISRNEYEDVFLRGRYGVNFNLGHGFNVKAVSRLETNFDSMSEQRRAQIPSGSNGRILQNEALLLDEMVLGYDYKNFSALVGKFDVNFGDAWRSDNGIWANEIAKSSYEQNYKMGLGAIQRFGDRKDVGEYVFGVSAFTNDRKNFDNSLISSNDQVLKSAGNPGDTRSLDSYVASADIYYDFGEREKLSYHFSYANLAINERQNKTNSADKINDEQSFALNMNYLKPLAENLSVKGFVEYVKTDNLGGDIDKSASFLTLNLTTYFHDVFLTLARSKKTEYGAGAKSLNDYINEISIGYKFDNLCPKLKGLSVMGGYNHKKDEERTSLTSTEGFGFMLRHKIEF
ncbi:MAG: hypothetical protein K0R25_230 [Rickettsiaceae bacterium]|jgi:hypothetical protein|nr:hypothetical protein [Rickettsiaceae bacterium]